MEQLGIVRQEAATSVFTVCLQELERPRYFYFLASFIAVLSSHLSVFSVCHPEINSDYSTELPIFQKINAMMWVLQEMDREGEGDKTIEEKLHHPARSALGPTSVS